MLDGQEDNYKRNTEVSIANAFDTFGKQCQAVAKNDTKELLGKFHDKLDNRFQRVESRMDKVETTTAGLSSEFAAMQKSLVEIQKEQTRQAEALSLADRNGVLTWADSV